MSERHRLGAATSALCDSAMPAIFTFNNAAHPRETRPFQVLHGQGQTAICAASERQVCDELCQARQVLVTKLDELASLTLCEGSTLSKNQRVQSLEFIPRIQEKLYLLFWCFR